MKMVGRGKRHLIKRIFQLCFRNFISTYTCTRINKPNLCTDWMHRCSEVNPTVASFFNILVCRHYFRKLESYECKQVNVSKGGMNPKLKTFPNSSKVALSYHYSSWEKRLGSKIEVDKNHGTEQKKS